MKKFALLLLLFPFVVHAQRTTPQSETDSLRYYENQLSAYFRRAYDSLRRTETVQTLQGHIIRVIQNKKNYGGLVLFADVVHTDFSRFNPVLAQNGFTELSPISTRFGFGGSFKRGNAMYDFYLVTLGFNTKSTKGNEKITTSFHNAVQLDFGIDLVNRQRVSVYPYGGLSFRASDLAYSKKGQANTTYTFLSNMRTDENSVTLGSARLGYQYGVGIDYSFAYNRNRTTKRILFIKGGVNRPFKTDTYKEKGITEYRPDIRQGDWLVSIGVKFANLHQ